MQELDWRCTFNSCGCR